MKLLGEILILVLAMFGAFAIPSNFNENSGFVNRQTPGAESRSMGIGGYNAVHNVEEYVVIMPWGMHMGYPPMPMMPLPTNYGMQQPGHFGGWNSRGWNSYSG